ncbi:anti-sigma factor [Massilia sp. DWR3-1-1]|uniref:anti-sigma factor n=1 Tax=Massilia sp. DWR3-1-1 TaxID=2804559 RepID=UPI003CF4B180
MSPVSSPSDPLHAEAGEYVLGTLSPAAKADVDRRLRLDPALRLAVQQWEADLLPLTALVAPVTPSAQLWRRIADSTAPPLVHKRPMWDSLGMWRMLTAGSMLATAVLAVSLAGRMPGGADKPQYMVVLVAPQDKAPGYVVQASASRELSLVPLNAAAVPANKSLQFWTKADGWGGPVSLGLVKPGQTITIPLDALPNIQPNQLFELTLEPVNGSPLNKPTGPIQFIGRAVKVM